jgi:hypothetical protein
MVDQLNLQIEQAKSLVEAYRAKALAAQKEWLTAGGGQKQLNMAAGNKKELKKVRVPIADFQKAGMEVALEELHERVDGCGPPISTVLMFTLTLAACFSPRASWEGAVAERINEIRDMDPRQLANKVFDSETMDILGGRIEQTQALVKTYQARAEEAKAAWLQSGGQAQLDAASPRASPITGAEAPPVVRVPVADMQKEALEAAMEELLANTGFSPRAGAEPFAARVQARPGRRSRLMAIPAVVAISV